MARLISWGQREEDTQRVSWDVSAIWSWTRTFPWRCRHRGRLPTRTRASPERHPCRPTLDGQRLGYENASRWVKFSGQGREGRRRCPAFKAEPAALIDALNADHVYACTIYTHRFITRIHHFCTDFHLND